MDDYKDRRAFERLEIPGMKAALISQFLHGILSYKIFTIFTEILMKQDLLKNISVNGACINSKNRLQPGDDVHMIISLPGDKNIPVKGSVKWISETDNREYFAGVQFMAFSKGKNYNSFDRLKQLNDYIPPGAVRN